MNEQTEDRSFNFYVAEPIDQRNFDQGPSFLGGALVTRAMAEAGHNSYSPMGAFRVGRKVPDGWLFRVNQEALASSDGLFAVLPAQVASVGTPAEIQFALDHGIPVVVATDLEATSYHLKGWAESGNFRAVRLTAPGISAGIKWLSATAAELADSPNGRPAGRLDIRVVDDRPAPDAMSRRRQIKARALAARYGGNPELAEWAAAELMALDAAGGFRPDRVVTDEELEAARLAHLGRTSHAARRPDRFVFEAKTENAKLPERAYGTDAGFDLFTSKRTVLMPGKSTYVPTGVAADIPDGYWGMITARSSTKFRLGLDVTVGVIDEGYSGELFASVFNPHPHPITVEEGDRLVQLIFVPTAGGGQAEWGEVRVKPRGANGFGSSGQKQMHENGATEAPTA